MPDGSGAPPRPKASRSARHAASHSGRPRSARRTSVVRILICGVALAGLRWGTPYLHRWITLPRLPHTLNSTVVTIASACLAIFMVSELGLLIAATATVRKPDVHRRIANLMLWWPYALVMPYVIIRSRKLPQQFLLTETGRRSQQEDPAPGDHASHQRQELPQVAPQRSHPPQSGEEGTPGYQARAVTVDEYRKALRLLIRHAQVLQEDRDLLNLCLLYLTAPDEAEQASAHVRADNAAAANDRSQLAVTAGQAHAKFEHWRSGSAQRSAPGSHATNVRGLRLLDPRIRAPMPWVTGVIP
jgi:hypothetical protein